jgi:hypothetical protein
MRNRRVRQSGGYLRVLTAEVIGVVEVVPTAVVEILFAYTSRELL